MNTYSYATHIHKVHYTILDQFDSPSSVTLCHTSRDLLKYVTHLGTPTFSSTCIHTCLYRGFVLVRGGFCSGVGLGVFCLEGASYVNRFRPGWFLSVPLLSEYIHYNRKLDITFNFRFHMYAIFLKV